MTQREYDVIVIGAGIPGQGVSALLARDGMRVLTLEKGREIGGRAYSFRQRGHITNMGGLARDSRTVGSTRSSRSLSASRASGASSTV